MTEGSRAGLRARQIRNRDTVGTEADPTSSVLNTEKIERRTSNAQHRTFNIDGAALNRL